MDDQEVQKFVKIDRYLKGEMDVQEKEAFEYELDQNAELRNEVEKTDISRQAIAYQGLRLDVSSIRSNMLKEEKSSIMPDKEVDEQKLQKKAVQRPLPVGLYALRVAASLLIVLVAFAAVQMATIDPQLVYSEKINLEVVDVVERSGEESTTLSVILEAYQNKNFKDIAAIFSSLEEPSLKEQYIAAAAFLQLHEYEQAENIYRQILDEDLSDPDQEYTNYWEQRAAYNLAITDIQLGNYEEAIHILEELKTNDVYGDYYDQLISDYALWKLRLLSFRQNLFE